MPDAHVSKHIIFALVARTSGRHHVRNEVVRSVHDGHDGDVDLDVIVPEMELHSVKPVDEYFIAGEVGAEVTFGASVDVIFAMREVHVVGIEFGCKGTTKNRHTQICMPIFLDFFILQLFTTSIGKILHLYMFFYIYFAL